MTYQDLYIETDLMPRIRLMDLAYGYTVTCSRTAGWEVWREGGLVAGEFDSRNGLRLDADGAVICNSLRTPQDA